jgi:aspartate racemase
MSLNLTVIGGMGPDAGVDFLSRYFMPEIKRHLGDRYLDQSVPSFSLLSRPVYDRTAALLAEAEGNPVPARTVAAQLQSALDQAASMQSSHVCVVCNTAHAFFVGNEHRPALDLRGMQLLDIRDAAWSRMPSDSKPALMATEATIEFELYVRPGRPDLILPDKDFIDISMAGIYDGVKKARLAFAEDRFRLVAKHLLGKGATHLILGCTEIPMALSNYPGLELIDPNRELAAMAVRALMS